MCYKIVCLLLSVAIILCTVTFSASADNNMLLSVSAKSAVLIDASDGKILYEKNADLQLPMASTTKIMTALIAIEHGVLEETVTVSAEAVGVEGSSIYLTAGERLTLMELLYAVLLSSANDAATAVAIHIGGSVEGFVTMMNQKAADLSLNNTHFCNPHGLNDKEHYTSAVDLARLTACALKNDIFAKIVATEKYEIPAGSGKRLLVNHNRLLRSYEGAIGVKTGFTRSSGRCLVSAARRDGLTLIAVTLSAPNDWNEHTKMLDYGFAFFKSETLCLEGERFGEAFVVSNENGKVYCVAKNTVNLTLLSHGEKISAVVERERFLWEMPNDGDKIGRVVFLRGEKQIAQVDLIAVTEGRESKPRDFWQFIRDLFKR